MNELIDTLSGAWNIIAVSFIFLLCVGGIFLSCISFSGTWLVLLSAILLAIIPETAFPGIWTIVFFIIICIGVEIMDFMAGWMGVQRRGGSRQAGVFAMLGGVLGLFLGSFIPIPILGSLIGMMVGSFVLAYIVERKRLEKTQAAANIAWGAVISRIIIILLKVCVTLGMTVYLVIGFFLSR